MYRLILSSAFLLFFGSQVLAAELTPDNIIGNYKVSARAGFMKVYLNFNVVSAQEFEIQRVYTSGRKDEVCKGKFDLNSHVFWDFDSLGAGKLFKGVFICPSKPDKPVDFNIDFKDKTTEDLAKGTNVTVTSSLAPGRNIQAHVKKH
ncbi:hypothetical protein [Bdellovibrio sp. HCB337]|uniref:hypothetical protein n=1 Tax=Bdellovibrio sp. HCB337 TaxID=3394358 RepID=UPI0039A6702C